MSLISPPRITWLLVVVVAVGVVVGVAVAAAAKFLVRDVCAAATAGEDDPFALSP
ncbi:Uncharacterised protein [Chlamydia trachomatis]|nr:Uncharacterised protein [Chlamydia trachomatis]